MERPYISRSVPVNVSGAKFLPRCARILSSFMEARLRGISLLRLLLVGTVVWMAWPSPVIAATLPPGNSEINQYTETLPGSHGDQPTGDALGGGGSKGGNGGSALTPSTANALRDRGSTGKAVVGLAQATTPKAGPKPTGGGSQKSGVTAAVDSLKGSDDGGLGIVFPLSLAAIAVVGVGYFLRRRAQAPQ